VFPEVTLPARLSFPSFKLFPFSFSVLFFLIIPSAFAFPIGSCLIVIILFFFVFLGFVFVWFSWLCLCLFFLVLFLFVSKTSFSPFRVLLHFITNCPIHSRARRSGPGADSSKRDSEEASGRWLEPMPPVNSSQRHKPLSDSILHTKTDDQHFFARLPQSRHQLGSRHPRCLASCPSTV
jgi:hypothetical protein